MKEHAPILIATVGLPRSGKTTWAREQGHPMVCPDAIRLALHGQRFIGSAEPFVWATALTMVPALFLAGHHVVILDATNNTKKRRDQWRNREWMTRFRVFSASETECKAVALRMGDSKIVPVIERMAAEFEPLTTEELELAIVEGVV